MSNLQNRIIETIKKDLERIKNLDGSKLKSKECAQLLKRVTDAKKLLASNGELIASLETLAAEIERVKKA